MSLNIKIKSNKTMGFWDPIAASTIRCLRSNVSSAGGCGRKTRYIAPPEFYINCYEAYWLRKADHKTFKDHFELFDWIKENKPVHEKHDLNYLISGLKFINPSVRNNFDEWMKCLKPYMQSFEYFTSNKGSWLKKAQTEDYLELFDWVNMNKPKDEDNTFGFLVNCISHCNVFARNNHKNWRNYIEPYEYYISKDGAWLKEAKDIKFLITSPIEPVEWILKHKPADDINPALFLFHCLRLCNRSIHKDDETEREFSMHFSAYSYILKNEAARTDMLAAFDEFKKEGHMPSNISSVMMRDKVNRSLFTHLDNPKECHNFDSINRILKVFLHFKILVDDKILIIAELQ